MYVQNLAMAFYIIQSKKPNSSNYLLRGLTHSASLTCSLQHHLLSLSPLAGPTTPLKETHLSFNAVTLDFRPGTLFLQILKGLPLSASSLPSDFTNEPFLNTLFSEILSHTIYHFKKAM